MEEQLTADPPPPARLLSIMDQQLLQTVSQLKKQTTVQDSFFKENIKYKSPSSDFIQ